MSAEAKSDKIVEVLFQISRSLLEKRDLDSILHEMVTLTAEVIDSKICAMFLLNERGDELLIRATQSLSTGYRGKGPVRVGQSVAGRALAAKEPIQVADVTTDPMYSFPQIAKAEGLKSLLSVPMMVGDKAIGILNCYTTRRKVFKPGEIRLIQTIANQAAMAIEHMRVVKDEASARLALETKKSVDGAKRLLMKRNRLSEEDAHRLIQKMSMDRNRPQKEIAEAILLSAELDK